jgi:alpha-methylacyl-CoA racemase
MTAAMAKPLEKLKILDFSYLIPGPYGTMLLSDMGADIIKVENSENPDIVRLMPPYVDDMSVVYAHLNRGKRSLSLNLKMPEARDIIYKLVQEYDVVIEQFRPCTMDRLGLGYEVLSKINPKLIYCSLTGFGQTGSFSNRAGHDINYMALSGVESISGRRETGPVLPAIQIADIASGSKNLVIGVLSAYINRMTSGQGDYIDVSITDGVFAMSVFAVAGFLAGNAEPQREDFLSGGSLYDFYATSDNGYLSVGPIEEKFFTVFCERIGCPDMAATGIINWNMKARIAKVIAGQTLAYWRERFGTCDACVEPVYSVGEAVANPPLSERAMVVPVRTVGGTSVNQIGNPIKFRSGHHYADTCGVPLGYHNDEILSRLGLGPQDIDRLKESTAVGK